MCLIIAVPKGVKKNGVFLNDSIANGISTNTEGAGIGYKKDGKVFYSKGIFSYDALIAELGQADLRDEDELIIHMRISTSGKIDEANTHPFVVSDVQKEIIEVKGSSPKGIMVHNGVFYNHSYRDSDYSDTYHFVKEFMCIPEFTSLLKRDRELFENIFKEKILQNKLAFLFPETDLITVGEFTEDQGYLFSNMGYKNTNYRNVGGKDVAVDSKVKHHTMESDLEITLTEDNFEELLLEPVGSYSGIASGQRCHIKHLYPNAGRIVVVPLNAPHITKNLDLKEFVYQCLIFPKIAFRAKYDDYTLMKDKIKATPKFLTALETHLSKKSYAYNIKGIGPVFRDTLQEYYDQHKHLITKEIVGAPVC